MRSGLRLCMCLGQQQASEAPRLPALLFSEGPTVCASQTLCVPESSGGTVKKYLDSQAFPWKIWFSRMEERVSLKEITPNASG